jgi:hypothetical protein
MLGWVIYLFRYLIYLFCSLTYLVYFTNITYLSHSFMCSLFCLSSCTFLFIYLYNCLLLSNLNEVFCGFSDPHQAT